MRRGLASTLERVARDYQREVVLSHCARCRTPCCRLETLVLELDWARVKRLWGLSVSRREFDAALARGEGPPEVRAQGGFYYAHQRVCPAYDEVRRLCRVYGGQLKPSGCSDFPVYEEDGCLTADRRCEVVDPEALVVRLRASLGARVRITVTEDPEFPFLVTLAVGRPARARGRG